MTPHTRPPPSVRREGPDTIASSVEGSTPLGGRPRSLRFPPFWQAWFARQTEARLAILDEMVDAHLERRVLRGFFRRLKHAVVVAFVAAAAAAHWFSDQLAWIVERWPVLRLVWHHLIGGHP